MQKTRVGVIGIGSLGGLHAKLYKEVPGAELIGVYDLDSSRAENIAAALNCQNFVSAEALFDRIEAVNIVTPTTAHHALARAALNCGKHVFIEKPITKTVAEADDLIALAEKKERLIQVGHIERFNAAMRAVNGLSLQPVFIESQRLAPFNSRGTDVDVVLDLMIHDLDLILNFTRSPVQKIDASGAAVVSRTHDVANARITFENGCVANITASRIALKKRRKMRLFEKDGYTTLDFLSGKSERLILQRNQNLSDSSQQKLLGSLEGETTKFVVRERLSAEPGNALLMELQAFIRSIRENRAPIVSAKAGRDALAIASRISHLISKSLPSN